MLLNSYKELLVQCRPKFRRLKVSATDSRAWLCTSYTLSLIYSEKIEKLIEGVSGFLRRTPRLLRNFNALLPTDYFRIECPTDLQEVQHITVITPSGARIQHTSGIPLVLPPPPAPQVTNTVELRQVLLSDHPWEIFSSPLESGWTSCLLQLLQTVRTS